MSTPYVPDHRLRPLLQRLGEIAGTELTPLQELKKDIHRYGKRRCDVEGSVDNLKYHVGFAFEVNGALNLPSLALTGLLSLPATAFADLFSNEEDFAGTLLDMLWRALAHPTVLDWALQKGVWLQ